MARYPSGEWRPLPEWRDEPAITPRAVILHTMVGSLRGTDSYFRNSTSLEAHFGVGWHGAVWQWQDTERQADANYKANDFAISIETEDGGDPSKPWTDAQLDAIVSLVGWCCDTHGIPRHQIDRWDGTGIGWHAMWGAPSRWTPSAGKTCPGQVRITQIRDVVLPRLVAPDQEEPVNVPPLVKKADSDKVWVVLGRTRSWLHDDVWQLMDPRAASRIITLPDDHPVWDFPVLEDGHVGQFAQVGHRHTGTVEVS